MVYKEMDKRDRTLNASVTSPPSPLSGSVVESWDNGTHYSKRDLIGVLIIEAADLQPHCFVYTMKAWKMVIQGNITHPLLDRFTDSSGEAGEPWPLLVATWMPLNSVTSLLVLLDLIVLIDQISVLILVYIWDSKKCNFDSFVCHGHVMILSNVQRKKCMWLNETCPRSCLKAFIKNSNNGGSCGLIKSKP